MNDILITNFEEYLENAMSDLIGYWDEADAFEMTFDLFRHKANHVQKIHKETLDQNGRVPSLRLIVHKAHEQNQKIVAEVAAVDYEFGRGFSSSSWEAVDLIPKRFRLDRFSAEECLLELWHERLLHQFMDTEGFVMDALIDMELPFTMYEEHPFSHLIGDTSEVVFLVNDCQNMLFYSVQESMIEAYAEKMEGYHDWRTTTYSESEYQLMLDTNTLLMERRR